MGVKVVLPYLKKWSACSLGWWSVDIYTTRMAKPGARAPSKIPFLSTPPMQRRAARWAGSRLWSPYEERAWLVGRAQWWEWWAYAQMEIDTSRLPVLRGGWS